MSEQLSITERKTYKALKETIRHGLKAYIEMGQAFYRIREERLYREDYSTFQEFVVQEWSVSREFVDATIRATETAEKFQSANVPAPVSKTHALELSKIEGDSERVEAWKHVIRITEGKPTVEDVRNVVREYSRAPKTGPIYARKSVALTPQNWKYVEEQAKARGISPSGFLSDLILLDRKQARNAKKAKRV